MSYEEIVAERRTFQSDRQIRMLSIHARLCAIAAVVYSPIRKVLESLTDTRVFRMVERPSLKLIK